MSVTVIEPPAEVIDLALAKAHLSVTHDDDDILIQAYIDAAVSVLDGPDGYLGRAIGVQTLELRVDGFTSCGGDLIALPFKPASAIAAVTYIDADGVEQTLAAEAYDLAPGPVLRPAYGQSWPSPRGDAGCVRIQYIAGWETPPKAIVAAILLMVGDLYANREPVQGQAPISPVAERLLAPFRVWSV